MRPHDDPADSRGATLATRRLNDMSSRGKRYQTDDQGKRTAIVLPIGEYEQLLEDVHDLAVVAERRDEPVLSAEELKRRLAEGDAV
jgi:hypothetical protein